MIDVNISFDILMYLEKEIADVESRLEEASKDGGIYCRLSQRSK